MVMKTENTPKKAKYVFNIDKITTLSDKEKLELKKVAEKYPFRASNYYLNLINWNDPHDPIRRLVIPNQNELIEWGKLDASNEKAITVRKGVQHKYKSTVLLLVNEVCGSFCRYCFRKRLFLNGNDEVTYDIKPGLDYIRSNTEVSNVLLTGGDPLIIQTPKLEKIIKALREIEHLRVIRIGSKMPAFNPYRITNDTSLIEMLKKYSLSDKRIYLMCHFDHPRELTEISKEAIRQVIDAGVICLNQNPIIKGISDDPKVMAELWNELSYMGVQQYYIFQGRPTAGNQPFEIPITEAYFKIEQAKKKCSGLGKRIKYVMSHESGKIEINGVDHKHIYLKYHRAKNHNDEQRLLVCRRNDKAYWLDQLEPANGYYNDYFKAGLSADNRSLN